jgi:hypothetical protein
VHDSETDEAAIYQESERAAMMRRARQKAGVGGAAMAGAMMALQGILEGPKKEPIAIVVAAPTEPINPDAEGISLKLDDRSLFAPPMAPLKPPKARRRKWGTSGR